MSQNREKFQALLANFKTNLKQSPAGVYVAEKLNALLNNKGVVLVSQRNVRDIEVAVRELQKAHDSMATALAALHYFPDVNLVPLTQAQAVTAEYKAVLVDVVEKAYQRRNAAVIGVTA